jgi:hypothetical protein
MDSLALKKKKTIFFGLLCLFVVSCARELRQESDFRISNDEFKQEIQSVNQESLNKIIQESPQNSELVVPTEAPQPKSSTENVIENSAIPQEEKKVDIPPPVIPKTAAKTKIEKSGKKSKSTSAQEKTALENQNQSGLESLFWKPDYWPFGVGEKITWALRYGPIEAGVATMEVLSPKVINNEAVLHYEATVKSAKLMELVYKVNDTMSTWTGLYDHLPRRQEINQNESGRWGKRIVVFDQNNSKAKFFSFTNFPDGRSEEIKREDTITPFAQDVLGALYFVRFINPQEYTNFPIHDRWKNWANELTYLGKESVRVPSGVFETFHYKMFPRVSGQLEPKGDVEIWVWDHPSRLLVQFSAQVKVGSVVGELKDYVPGKAFTIPPPGLKTPKVLKAD